MNLFKLKDVKAKEMVPGYHAKIVHSKNMTFVYWDIKADYVLPEHSHPHEQVANITEGTFELTINGESQIMEPGSIAIIPSGAIHTGKGISDCKLADSYRISCIKPPPRFISQIEKILNAGKGLSPINRVSYGSYGSTGRVLPTNAIKAEKTNVYHINHVLSLKYILLV